MICHAYTEQQNNWLRSNYLTLPGEAMAEQFNALFGTNITTEALKQKCLRLGLKRKNDGRFVKGQKAWNHGKRGYMGANSTSFKPGNTPKNIKPIGHERLSKDGYIEVKVAQPNKFEPKARAVWRQHFGQIAKGIKIIFLDGDKQNTDINNLAAVSSGELATLNRHENFADQPAEIKKSLIALIRMEQTAKRSAA